MKMDWKTALVVGVAVSAIAVSGCKKKTADETSAPAAATETPATPPASGPETMSAPAPSAPATMPSAPPASK